MRSKLYFVFKLLVGGFLGLSFLLVVGFYLLGKGLCGTSGLVEFKSPFDKRVITRSMFDCGATTDYTTNLTLKEFPKDINITSLKGAHEDDLNVKWLDKNIVEVNYTGNREVIYGYSEEVSGIKIIYKNGNEDLKITCLYEKCEQIDREKALVQRKEWCNYSKENREYCDAPENKGWEICEDGSWCHYTEPQCDYEKGINTKKCDDAWAEANRPLKTREEQIQFMKEKTEEIKMFDDLSLKQTFLYEASKYLKDPDPYYAFKASAFLVELEKRKFNDKEVDDMRLELIDKYSPCWGIPTGDCKE